MQRAEPRRRNAWLWGYAVIVANYALAWLDTDGGMRIIGRPLGDLRVPAAFALPVIAVAGVTMAFLRPRHRFLRTVSLSIFAQYVAGVTAVFAFGTSGLDCSQCATSAGTRLVGFAATTVLWFVGRAVEEGVVRVRART